MTGRDVLLGDVKERRMVGVNESAVRNMVVDDTERKIIASADNLMLCKDVNVNLWQCDAANNLFCR